LSAIPGEVQGAAEKCGQTFGFLPGRPAHPYWRFDKRFDDDFDAATLDFVALSSAEDISWACKPQRRLATASMLPARARRSR
jgi:hypothetical protein